MATHVRRDARSVNQRLREEAHRFDFYQAVRLLKIDLRRKQDRRRKKALRHKDRFDFSQAVRRLRIDLPRKADWRRKGAPRHKDRVQAVRLLKMNLRTKADPLEKVRFRSSTSMAFPATDVDSLRRDKDGTLELWVNFLGMAGAHGPLPDPFTELLRDRLRDGDSALRDFLDIFNHRLVSLMYEARARRRVGMGVSHPRHHPFARYLSAVLGTLDWPERLQLGLIPHTRVLTSGAHDSMSALEQLLAERLGTRVEGQPLVGDWLPLAPEQQTRIGTGSLALGRGAVLGTRAWDPQARFTLRFGPLPWREFVQLLPGHTAFGTAVTYTRLVAPPHLSFDFVLLLDAKDAPALRLRSRRKLNRGPRLGRTSWLSPITPSAEPLEVRLSSRHIRSA
ncbi:type VI secretion system baseplate subunit TssG [Corallococcus exiguus]|uniref:type VI secretion system baseplate subunit TssG n=1 Tax=Corallococcus TaxID=83461 RepID=UPI000ECF54D7|nr:MULTISPECIES: type VI secretion system baseplate subunit TssG [Corallococcus]NNC20844.1 type VI secretion system baseplate subunit TssG [Corallococcus exiguus]RKI19086.1 type VI secretion system baseplate subunit TssG [Corallococcus sp. AB030]